MAMPLALAIWNRYAGKHKKWYRETHQNETQMRGMHGGLQWCPNRWWPTENEQLFGKWKAHMFVNETVVFCEYRVRIVGTTTHTIHYCWQCNNNARTQLRHSSGPQSWSIICPTLPLYMHKTKSQTNGTCPCVLCYFYRCNRVLGYGPCSHNEPHTPDEPLVQIVRFGISTLTSRQSFHSL